MSMYSNRLQPGLQDLLQCVVRFLHQRCRLRNDLYCVEWDVKL